MAWVRGKGRGYVSSCWIDLVLMMSFTTPVWNQYCQECCKTLYLAVECWIEDIPSCVESFSLYVIVVPNVRAARGVDNSFSGKDVFVPSLRASYLL